MGILGDSVVEVCKGYVSPSLQINDVCSISACFSELELRLGDLGEVGSDPRPPQPESLLSVLTRTLGSEGTAVVAPAFPVIHFCPCAQSCSRPHSQASLLLPGI